MNNEEVILKASKVLDIRFSEVDSMNVVWHGSYMLYFEDAREEFGRKYKLEYLRIADFGYYAPLVDMQFHYRKPITYGMRPRIDIIYRPTEAAKIVFDYEIQIWTNPEFYIEWKKMWGINTESVK